MLKQEFQILENRLQMLWDQDIDSILTECNNEERSVYLIAYSGFFDTKWYIEQYHDVYNSGIDPILHYVLFGYKENRNPTEWFDTHFYLEENIDVKKSGINPFLHYIYNGSYEGRRPNKYIEKKELPVKDYEYYKNISPRYYPRELKDWYKNYRGRNLNLKNPQTFNEKIQWIKLYDNSPLKTHLTDKYLVREWVKEKIGIEYLVPLFGVWDSFDEINFDILPNKFVLKANHGSGWNIMVADKAKFNKQEAKIKFDKWMHTNFAFCYGFELHYRDIKPKIIAEEYIENDKNLYDYKIMFLNKKPVFIWVDSERFTNHKKDIFDLNWNLLPFTIGYKNSDNPPKKPKNLDQMLHLAKKLIPDFACVRVDFYNLNNERIKFGELTFTSCSGLDRFNPEEFDLYYGKRLTLPSLLNI